VRWKCLDLLEFETTQNEDTDDVDRFLEITLVDRKTAKIYLDECGNLDQAVDKFLEGIKLRRQRAAALSAFSKPIASVHQSSPTRSPPRKKRNVGDDKLKMMMLKLWTWSLL